MDRSGRGGGAAAAAGTSGAILSASLVTRSSDRHPHRSDAQRAGAPWQLKLEQVKHKLRQRGPGDDLGLLGRQVPIGQMQQELIELYQGAFEVPELTWASWRDTGQRGGVR